jgi:hypothetical protein
MGFVVIEHGSSVVLTRIGRLGYAAAFFLLGGALKDAVRICLRQIGDVQLAIALARIVEGNDDGPVLQEILRETVVPLAFKDGNRWLASWAFWLSHRRDLAVRILVVCFIPVVSKSIDLTSRGHLLDSIARCRQGARCPNPFDRGSTL